MLPKKAPKVGILDKLNSDSSLLGVLLQYTY